MEEDGQGVLRRVDQGRLRLDQLARSDSRAALWWLVGRWAILELLQPLVDDMVVVLRVEVEEAVCRDDEGLCLGGERRGTTACGQRPIVPIQRSMLKFCGLIHARALSAS